MGNLRNGNADSGEGLYVDATTQRYEVRFGTNARQPVSGVIEANASGRTFLGNWSDSPPRGYFELPFTYPQPLDFSLFVYVPHALVQNASVPVHQIWHWHSARLFVVDTLPLGGRTYYFENSTDTRYNVQGPGLDINFWSTEFIGVESWNHFAASWVGLLDGLQEDP
ncbi:MAG: hypothetical protein ACYDBQ_07125 [Thermoplasmatota archaeon]